MDTIASTGKAPLNIFSVVFIFYTKNSENSEITAAGPGEAPHIREIGARPHRRQDYRQGKRRIIYGRRRGAKAHMPPLPAVLRRRGVEAGGLQPPAPQKSRSDGQAGEPGRAYAPPARPI